MSAKSHPRLVGAFVLGAVVLVLAAVLLLTSRGWFEKRARFSVFFPGSLSGLSRGAPVTFRGIKIGEVAEVKALLTGKPSPLIEIEVVIELVGDMVDAPPGVARPFSSLSAPGLAKELIDRGIRGRLLSQSLLTGQKYIDFDFLPDEPARTSGLSHRYPELPTTPTAMEKLSDRAESIMNKLADLPLDRMLENLRKTLESARALLESPDLHGTLAGARRATENVPPTLEEVRAAVADARRLMETVGGETRSTASDARETIRAAREALDRVDGTLKTLDSTLAGTDEARIRAAQTLQELERTLKALRNLVDYVQTHPEAVVLGKPKEERK
ncbi:MAG TPA: MlaD family protein [Vicinamibacteria bacterium]|nr:MlaD family protein [Vicinamibacteria bacterium]